MPIKGIRDIKNATHIRGYKEAKNLKSLEAIKHVDAIKGLKDIKGVKRSEGREDQSGLSQLQEGLQEKAETLRQNLQSAQSKLQIGVHTVRESFGENIQRLRGNVGQVGDLPQTIENALIPKTGEVGGQELTKNTEPRRNHAVQMPLEATESVGGAVEKMAQPGVDTTPEGSGKSAGKIGQEMEKTPGKRKSFSGSLEKRLQSDIGILREDTKKHFKKDQS